MSNPTIHEHTWGQWEDNEAITAEKMNAIENNITYLINEDFVKIFTVYMSPQGSDDNLGTKESPYLTLTKAFSNPATTTVICEPGLYNDFIHLSNRKVKISCQNGYATFTQIRTMGVFLLDNCEFEFDHIIAADNYDAQGTPGVGQGNGGSGFYARRSTGTYTDCIAYNNYRNGFTNVNSDVIFYHCESYNNKNDGFNGTEGSTSDNLLANTEISKQRGTSSSLNVIMPLKLLTDETTYTLPADTQQTYILSFDWTISAGNNKPINVRQLRPKIANYEIKSNNSFFNNRIEFSDKAQGYQWIQVLPNSPLTGNYYCLFQLTDSQVKVSEASRQKIIVEIMGAQSPTGESLGIIELTLSNCKLVTYTRPINNLTLFNCKAYNNFDDGVSCHMFGQMHIHGGEFYSNDSNSGGGVAAHNFCYSEINNAYIHDNPHGVEAQSPTPHYTNETSLPSLIMNNNILHKNTYGIQASYYNIIGINNVFSATQNDIKSTAHFEDYGTSSYASEVIEESAGDVITTPTT